MSDSLEERDEKVSKECRTLTNQRFADGTDVLATERQELQELKPKRKILTKSIQCIKWKISTDD